MTDQDPTRSSRHRPSRRPRPTLDRRRRPRSPPRAARAGAGGRRSGGARSPPPPGRGAGDRRDRAAAARAVPAAGARRRADVPAAPGRGRRRRDGARRRGLGAEEGPGPRQVGRRPRHRRPGRRLGRRRGRAAHRRVGHAVGPRLDPGRQRHLRRGQARPPRRPAGRARQGPQRLPGLRRPGRVPDQDQRGPRPARRQGVRRQAELHGRHPALVRRPARRQRRTPADGRRRLDGALPRPRERQGRGQGHGLGGDHAPETGATSTTETYNGVTITVIKPPADVSAMAKDVQLAYAVTGPVLAIGDTSSVKAAIDTGGKTGLNTNDAVQDRLGDDHRRPARLRLRRHRGHRDGRLGHAPRRRRRRRPAVPAVLDGLYPDWVGRRGRGRRRRARRRVAPARTTRSSATATNAASTLPSHRPGRHRRRSSTSQRPGRAR